MGSSKEREMVNTFEDHDFAALRAGASGGGTTRNLPDVLASDGTSTFGIEEKYRGGEKHCTFSDEEVEDLVEFCERFGATALLAVRFSTRLDGVTTADWFLVPPDEARRTDGGNYALNHNDVQGEVTLSTLLEELLQV